MANQWQTPDYVDGDWTVAKPCSLPEFSAPVPGDPTEYVFTQDFMALRTIAAASTLNTAHPSSGLSPDYSAWVLVEESDTKQDVGNGIVRWRRTYAKVPAQHNEWESYAYSFIGTAPFLALSTAQEGRLRFVERVTSRVQHDYYLVGTGQTYTTPGAIPILKQFAYCVQDTVGGVNYGGWYSRQDYLFDGPSVLDTNVGKLWKTTPTLTEYWSMMKEAADKTWTSAVCYQTLTADNPPRINLATSSYAGGQIIAEDSELSRWLGNIWLRRTRYVLAR